MASVNSCRSENPQQGTVVPDASRGNGGADRGITGSRRARSCDTAYDMEKLPYTPGLSKRGPKSRMRLTDRAALVRKALQFGPLTLPELRARLGCSRFAVRKTLAVMTDVRVDRRPVTVVRHVVAMRGAA